MKPAGQQAAPWIEPFFVAKSRQELQSTSCKPFDTSEPLRRFFRQSCIEDRFRGGGYIVFGAAEF
jgi:hypothetical protein